VKQRASLPAFAVTLIAVALMFGHPVDAQTKPIVSGAGSTWSQIAVDQWRADVSRFGLRINYQGVGSSSGRQFYINDQVDFAVSEIPFEGQELDALRAKGKEWAYLPIVAGGTSFMYNLRDGAGAPITTLRLSSATAVGIFTGGITKWSDPALTAENPGLNLPDKPIVPVVRSDGSGTSAQFTGYLSKREQSTWCAFAKKNGIDCGHTSNYPGFPGSVAQSGSDGVANYVHSESTGAGAITYVEAGYAIQRGRPVAFLKNGSGNYTLPTSKNVSTALTKATLNSDDTQNLDEVYVSTDTDAYALSSYSYMIVPTKDIDTAKGDALGSFMAYFACEGQRKADQLGYAPLPQNLVEVVFNAMRKVPGSPAPPPISECSNPTITGDGGTSDDTAEALSGGASSSGTAPASPAADGGVQPAPFDGSAGGTSGGTAAGSTGGGSTGSTSGGGTTSTSNGGTDASGGGGTGGSGGSTSSSDGGLTSGGVNGALSTEALQAAGLTDTGGGGGGGGSSVGVSSSGGGALTAAGLAVALLIFLPPFLSGFRSRRQDLTGRLEAIDHRLQLLTETLDTGRR
jgi:phosphate transport system substrate-binding protein